MSKTETPAPHPVSPALPKPSIQTSVPKATITVNPEGTGWVVRIGREFVRNERGVIKSYDSAGDAKREVISWRPQAPSLAARQRGNRRLKHHEPE